MSEFTDRPFAAGSVVGLRSFSVNADGQLTGVVRGRPWLPGENVAVCDKPEDGLTYIVRTLSGEPRPDPPPHRQASMDCTCGFYAYFDGSNDYTWRGGVVTGIIEGYGLVTVGSRGFRAERARIVALVRPSQLGPFDCDCRLCMAPDPLANYPDIPLYDTTEQALAEHPLTKPEDVGVKPPPTLGFSAADAARALEQMRTAMLQPPVLFVPPMAPPEHEQTPLQRKRSAAEEAAERRIKAGLRNAGGIDRRRRKP